jgi:hypothetical protein
MTIIVEHDHLLTSVILHTDGAILVEAYCDKCDQWYNIETEHKCTVVIDGTIRDASLLLKGGEDG